MNPEVTLETAAKPHFSANGKDEKFKDSYPRLFAQALKAPLATRSKELRKETYLLSSKNGGYHYGGSFSSTEILISLFDDVLLPEDKFVMSKGHACWPYYVLLREKGKNPLLEGHPYRNAEEGVHYTTGSEGHGMPASIGMAFARKLQKISGRIFVLVGDGECQEGTFWESLLLGKKLNVDNLTVVVDYNNIQGSGYVSDILPLEAMPEVAKAVGWDVRVINGHSMEELYSAFMTPSATQNPILVVAVTVKGKGASFMENKPEWHAKWIDEKLAQDLFKELA